MSLNGLEDASVKEAYEATLVEAGRWFLLKYASRDELELLERGAGGIIEVRNSISRHEETWPLYGLIRYRRRNIIIKYMPDDCSRLVKARASVHYNAVCERFSPYHATIETTSLKDLTETKLSTACSLHTAPGSASSSTSSLRQRPLIEIVEEVEDDEEDKKRQSVEERPATADGERLSKMISHSSSRYSTNHTVMLKSDVANLPDASESAEDREPPVLACGSRSGSPTQSYDDATKYLYHYGKPRVKLGPRPLQDIEGRPRTSVGSGTCLPVSAIPAGLKVKGSKREQAQARRGSSGSTQQEAEQTKLDAPAATPDGQDADPEASRQQTSSEQANTATCLETSGKPSVLPWIPPPGSIPKQTTLTPEKARLAKAMKLREQRKKMSMQPAAEPRTTEEPKALAHKMAELLRYPDEGVKIECEGVDMKTELGTCGDAHPDRSPAGSEVKANSCDSILESNPGIGAAERRQGSGSDMKFVDEIDQVIVGTRPRLSGVEMEAASAHHEIPAKADRNSGVHTREDNIEVDGDGSGTETGPITDMKDEVEPPTDHGGRSGVTAETVPSGREEGRASPSHVVNCNLSTASATPATPMVTIRRGAAAESAKKGKLGDATTDSDVTESTLIEGATSDPVLLPVFRFTTSEAPSPHSSPISPLTRRGPRVDDEETAVAGCRTYRSPGSAETVILLPSQTGSAAYGQDRRPSLAISENEELLNELQTARVEEARPVTISKSPVTQTFPAVLVAGKRVAMVENRHFPSVARTKSNPTRGSLLSPGDVLPNSARSVSSGAGYLHQIKAKQSSNELKLKSAKIGTSISQRIKALEKLTGGPLEEASRDQAGTSRPSSSFFLVRNFNESTRCSSIDDQAISPTRPPCTASSFESQEAVSDSSKLTIRKRHSGSLATKLSVFEGGNAPVGRTDFVQVTARIVRDTSPGPGDGQRKLNHHGRLDLKESHLVIDLQGATSPRDRGAGTTSPPEGGRQAENDRSILQRRMSRRSLPRDNTAESKGGKDGKYGDAARPDPRPSLNMVKNFIRDRRGSVMKTPSMDNLAVPISPSVPGSRALSLTVHTSLFSSRPPSTQQTSAFSRTMSNSSRRSSNDHKTPSGLLSPLKIARGDEDCDDECEESNASGVKRRGSGSSPASAATSPTVGKGSRASRFMRCLSHSLVSGRKNVTPSISPTVVEEDVEDVDEVEAAGDNGTIDDEQDQRKERHVWHRSVHHLVTPMGDVNVQFPDNLLWKRRTMYLDSQGFLILSAVQNVTATTPRTTASRDRRHQAGAIKCYHMTDFMPPYTPEFDLQDLPNSVILDFFDESSLQIACDDLAGQNKMLQVLEDAHQTHTTFGS